MRIAVVTGASSGLGAEYVKQITLQMPKIEEIWIIARHREKLERVAARFSEYTVRCLPLDLTDPGSFVTYRALLEQETPDIALLINNAGFGKLGPVAKSKYEEQTGMIDLNCRALTAITTLSLPYMKRGAGILNVCSIASYSPTPRMTVYGATKAYIASFSKALRVELRPKKINVLTVCPGPMATDFLEVANIIGHSKAFETLPYCYPETVAANSLCRLLRGKAWYTNRFIYKFYRVLCKLLPHSLTMKFSKT